MKKYKVKHKSELKKIVREADADADLNYLDVSNITDMYMLFKNSMFNGDISKWDVSNVTDMSFMFWRSQFKGDISKWDVSNVDTMYSMYSISKFKGDIWKWQVNPKCDMDEFGIYGINSYEDFVKYAELHINKRKKAYKKVGSFADWLDI